MEQQLKDKFKKVLALVEAGATDGEKAAAAAALNRLMEKYKIDESQLSSLELNDYYFTYKTKLEIILISQIVKIMLCLKPQVVIRYHYWSNGKKVKQLQVQLKYEDYILLECAYEYFRRHMNAQYKTIVLPQLKNCRKVKTRNKLREELSTFFITRYLIESKLVRDEDVETIEVTNDDERRKRMLMRRVEGGAFNKQMNGNNFLDY